MLDILIAITAAKMGAVLATENLSDMKRRYFQDLEKGLKWKLLRLRTSVYYNKSRNCLLIKFQTLTYFSALSRLMYKPKFPF